MDKLKNFWGNSGIIKKIIAIVVGILLFFVVLGMFIGVYDIITGNDTLGTNDKKTEQKEETTNKEDTTQKEKTNKKEETPKQEEKDVKSIFLKHNFKDFNGNMRLDNINDNPDDNIRFMFSGGSSTDYFNVYQDGITITYFYNANYGWVGTAKYDYATNSFREGATGTDADKEKIDYAKAIFESTLKSLGLTIDNLNNYAKSIK